MVAARIICFMRGVHVGARRHPLGGWRCEECGFAGASLADMGFGREAGYVNQTRKVFSREGGGTVTRTSAWAPTESGRGW